MDLTAIFSGLVILAVALLALAWFRLDERISSLKDTTNIALRGKVGLFDPICSWQIPRFDAWVRAIVADMDEETRIAEEAAAAEAEADQAAADARREKLIDILISIPGYPDGNPASVADFEAKEAKWNAAIDEAADAIEALA